MSVLYYYVLYYLIGITDAFKCKQHFNAVVGRGGDKFNYFTVHAVG